MPNTNKMPPNPPIAPRKFNQDFIIDFRNLKNFELKFERTEFTLIPIMSSLTTLTNLDMKSNRIERLDSHVKLPYTIVILDLSYNKITYILEYFFLQFAFLVELYLAHNRIRTIGPLEFSSNNLKLISLAHNQLDTFGLVLDMVNPTELRELDLSSNALDEILDSRFDLGSSIRRLNLSSQRSNKFLNGKSISEALFWRLPAVLDRVSLRDCALCWFNASLTSQKGHSDTTRIQSMDLSFNFFDESFLKMMVEGFGEKKNSSSNISSSVFYPQYVRSEVACKSEFIRYDRLGSEWRVGRKPNCTKCGFLMNNGPNYVEDLVIVDVDLPLVVQLHEFLFENLVRIVGAYLTLVGFFTALFIALFFGT